MVDGVYFRGHEKRDHSPCPQPCVFDSPCPQLCVFEHVHVPVLFIGIVRVCGSVCVCVCMCACTHMLILCVHVFAMLCMKMFVNFHVLYACLYI